MFLNKLDHFLNTITMYRLVLSSLLLTSGTAIIFGYIGWLPYPGINLLSSVVFLLITCGGLNFLISLIIKAPINIESSFISAFILFLILAPAQTSSEWTTLLFASVLCVGSKYVLAIKKKHIFNPVAITLAILTLLRNPNVYWWVGSLVLLPFVVVSGLMIVRKIRRTELFVSFVIVATVTLIAFGVMNQVNIGQLIWQIIASYPLIFLATIMLTEPLTTPPHKNQQIAYGALVGALFGSQFHIGPIISTPELALVIGNLFTYLISPKYKLFLPLLSKKEIAKDTYAFSFKLNQPFNFKPGQYLEWTLPLLQTDNRGNRRFFTIASSPTEEHLLLGIRYNPGPSSFKQHLMNLKPGQEIAASQLSGDFVLPDNPTTKLVFIAGGIGITPFRSMIKYLSDKQETRKITLFYANRHQDEIAYKDIFDLAEKKIDLTTIYLLSDKNNLPKKWRGEVGYLTSEILTKHVPDFAKCKYYLSGPNSMVNSYQQLLRNLGIPRNQIIKDYFPGF